MVYDTRLVPITISACFVSSHNKTDTTRHHPTIIHCQQVNQNPVMSSRKRKVGADGEDIEGVQLFYEGESAVTLSAKETRDTERWRDGMPSVARFTDLTTLDLHKNRYITQLHPSVTTLKHLKILDLTQCSRLVSLPDDLDSLSNLQVVRHMFLVL